MKTIVLAGWREGLQKVALTALQRELLSLSLKEAKENVDRLLEANEGEWPSNPVVLDVPDELVAEFSRRADERGVLVGQVSFSPAKVPIQRKHNPIASTPKQAA